MISKNLSKKRHSLFIRKDLMSSFLGYLVKGSGKSYKKSYYGRISTELLVLGVRN